MPVKVNQTLFLQVASLEAKASEEVYKSRIADVDKDYLYIEVPLHEQTGSYKALEPGDQLSVQYITDGGNHYFESEVLGFSQDVIKLVAITKPSPKEITRSQRRTFLRVGAKLELAVRMGDNLQFLAVTEDVGGGGISFVSDSHIPLQVGDMLHCWLLIHGRNKEIEHAQFKGEVVRVKAQQADKQLTMLKFVDIADAEQQKIIRYAFEKQLELRKL